MNNRDRKEITRRLDRIELWLGKAQRDKNIKWFLEKIEADFAALRKMAEEKRR